MGILLALILVYKNENEMKDLHLTTQRSRNTLSCCGSHTVLGSVVLLYIYTLVQPLFTLRLCTQLHCTTVHLLVPAWPMSCQLITEGLRFTCFALIGPLGVPLTLPPNCCMLTQPFCPAEQKLQSRVWVLV
jgi:hypothetical protein